MSTTRPVRVALVDDHALFRTSLAGMIDRMGGYKVVVEAAHGEECMDAMAEEPVDLAIVDLHMGIMDGYATIAWIAKEHPATRALALTFEKTESAMLRSLRAGACGFLLKDVRMEVFKQALDEVVSHGHYMGDEQQHALLAEGGHRPANAVMEQFTGREAEFTRLVCHENEYTYDQIADIMQVHRRTVDGFREGIFKKFGIRSKTGLVLFAYKWGVVE
jgi:DNA-binding NarL/FixJ family response regulator